MAGLTSTRKTKLDFGKSLGEHVKAALTYCSESVQAVKAVNALTSPKQFVPVVTKEERQLVAY